MKKLAWLIIVLLGAIILLTLNPKPALAAQNSATFQIQNGNDDVNQDGTTFTATGSTLWIGNSTSTTSGYAGLRFINVSIPQGATITSAQIQVYSSQSQWISISIQIAGDLSANSAAFSSTSLPSQRSLTTAKVISSTNTSWAANTWYLLPDISTVIQELVSQPGWQSGNSLSLVIKGTGSAYARKFAQSYEGSAANAAELIVTYQTGATSTVTPTSISSVTSTQTALPTLTRTPSKTSSPTTTTPIASATSTQTALPTLTRTPSKTSSPTTTTPIASATSTQTALPTLTRTPTQTILPSATTTFTSGPPTPSPTTVTGLSLTNFAINTGWADVIPHQLIRTGDDRLYFFGSSGDGSTKLNVYWTAGPGLPNLTSDFSGSAFLTYPATIISVSPAYDGANIVHLITNSTDGNLKDVPFNLNTNSFQTPKVLDTGLTTANTDIGTAGVSAAFDLGGSLDIAYWSGSNHILFRSYQYNPPTDALTLVSGPTQVDSAGNANHPNLAVSPSDNSLTIAWVSQASSPTSILTRTSTGGAWGAIQTASTAPVWTSPNTGINIDQGPSLVIDAAGVKYLAYIEDFRISSPYDYGRVHYVVNQGAGWSDTYTGFYAHDPAVDLDNADNLYIVGHGYPLNPSPCDSVDKMCLYARSVSGVWTGNLVAAPTGSNTFDTSPSTKWSAVGFNRPETVEFVFSEAINGSYNNTLIHYGRINPSGQSPTPTTAPTTTPLPTSTPSLTATQSQTQTATPQPSLTATLSPTPTLTPLPSQTPVPTATSTSTLPADTDTPTPTLTPLPSSTPIPTDTLTSTLPADTDTPTPSLTPLPSLTPVPTDTLTPTLPADTDTPTPSLTPLPSLTPVPTDTLTPTLPADTDTPTPSLTPSPSLTPIPTDTLTPTPPADTDTPTPSLTPLPSSTPVPTDTSTPTLPADTNTPTPSITPLPSSTPVPTDTLTPTLPADTDMPTPTLTPLPSLTPIPTDTDTPTPTLTPLPSSTPVPTDTLTPTLPADTDTPTPSLTPLPSLTPVPTDTLTPTLPSDTDTPTPTLTPSPSLTSLPTDTLTPTLPSDTDTPTPTLTPLPSSTPDPTDTLTPTLPSDTDTPTPSLTPLPSSTPVPTDTLTPTLPADTDTPTPSLTPQPSSTPDPTDTLTPTLPADTDTPTPSLTPLPSSTPVPTDTSTPTLPADTNTPTPSLTPLPSSTAVPTDTLTPTLPADTDSPTPTLTPLPSQTPVPTDTFTPTLPADTDTPTPILTPQPSPTPLPSDTPLPSPTPLPTVTLTSTLSAATNTPTPTLTPSPSATPSPTVTQTPSLPADTATSTATLTPLPSPTPLPTVTLTSTLPAATNTPTPTHTPLPSPTPSPTATLTPTLTATKTATPTPTPTQILPSPTTPPILTFQVNASGDDVNQDGTTLTTNGSTVWIGNGVSTTSSYAGFRFNQVTLPRGATIKSAQLQLYSSQKQWITVNITITGDLSANSAPFTTTSLPSQRPSTVSNIVSSTNVNWNASTWYALPDLSTVIQEIVNQAGWQNGNSLSILVKGTGSAYSRKYANSEDGSPTYAAKLIITYQ